MTAPSPGSSPARKKWARRQWSRRLSPWRPVLVIAGIVVLVAGSLWAVFYSDLLAVRGVSVQGLRSGSVLTPAQVEAAARPPIGRPLARADLETVRRRVAGLPAVREVEVGRAWPHDIAVTVTERTPVAIWRDGSTLHLVDRTGVPFHRVARAPRNLRVVVVPAGPEPKVRSRRAAGAKVAAGLPGSLSAKVELIEVRSPDAVTLKMANGATVKWGSAEKPGMKAKVLEALLHKKRELYDVSVPGFPTVRG